MNIIKDVPNERGIIMYFYTDWCGYCKQAKPNWDLASKRLQEQFKWVTFDCSKRTSFPTLKKKYNVKAYPTVIGLSPKNNTGKRTVIPFQGEMTVSNLQLFATTLDKSACKRTINIKKKLNEMKL